jgi:hypothetical protein
MYNPQPKYDALLRSDPDDSPLMSRIGFLMTGLYAGCQNDLHTFCRDDEK